MIEVEKKVALGEEDLKQIEKLGTYLGCQTLTDTYFDTAEFRYTTSDIWLRERECKYELKIGIPGFSGTVDRYEEISDEREIIEKLGLDKKEKDLSKALQKARIFPYATFQTVRRKYKLDALTIDLDLAYFDDFIYRIAEIEMIVSDQNQVADAEAAIESFVSKMGLESDQPVKAKLIEYLSQKNPSHYQALQTSGVVE